MKKFGSKVRNDKILARRAGERDLNKDQVSE